MMYIMPGLRNYELLNANGWLWKRMPRMLVQQWEGPAEAKCHVSCRNATKVHENVAAVKQLKRPSECRKMLINATISREMVKRPMRRRSYIKVWEGGENKATNANAMNVP
jgi:hypothetical protein